MCKCVCVCVCVCVCDFVCACVYAMHNVFQLLSVGLEIAIHMQNNTVHYNATLHYTIHIDIFIADRWNLIICFVKSWRYKASQILSNALINQWKMKIRITFSTGIINIHVICETNISVSNHLKCRGSLRTSLQVAIVSASSRAIRETALRRQKIVWSIQFCTWGLLRWVLESCCMNSSCSGWL